MLYKDNNSYIAQTENPLRYKRTKHINIAYYFTRQIIDKDVVVLVKIDTADQVADMLTKPLENILFNKHFNMLKMKDTKVSLQM